MSNRLVFHQPSIGISAALKAIEPRRSFTITASSHCRALLCTRIQELFRQKLATRTQRRVASPYSWRSGTTYTTYTARGNLALDGEPVPAELSIATSALRRSKKGSKRYWDWDGPVFTPEKGAIPIQRVRDFYYLADLLCGTFGVLLGKPRGRGAKKFSRPRPRRVPTRLEYPGVDTSAMLHPGLLSLYLGQLRLAALLAASDQVAAIKRVAPDRTVQAALRRGDRKACATLLRRAQPWILRSETGLWAFQRRNPERFRKLLTFLNAGNTAEDLFETDVAKNWSINAKDNYFGGGDFHDRGFQDFMRQSGDQKIGATKKKTKK